MSTGEFFNIAAVLLILAGVIALVGAVFKTYRAAGVVLAINAIALLFMAAGFGLRWKYYIDTMNVGWLLAFPVSTFYESATFFLMSLLAAFLGVFGFRARKMKKEGGAKDCARPEIAQTTEGLTWFVVDFSAGIGILGLSLANISSEPVLFLPSLKSYWLLAHVALSFIAYGMFALAAILAVLALCRSDGREANMARIRALVRAGIVVFTIGGIFFGALWAQTSWGRFWAWDPKETWAFVTWCCYLALIHFDRNNRLSPKKLSIFAIMNFVVVIFTFVGVNVLFAGLHSYALIDSGV